LLLLLLLLLLLPVLLLLLCCCCCCCVFTANAASMPAAAGLYNHTSVPQQTTFHRESRLPVPAAE
jgi:hypothetical protein